VRTILDQNFQLSNSGNSIAAIFAALAAAAFDKWNFFAKINLTA
jgi:hypothetical protein